MGPEHTDWIVTTVGSPTNIEKQSYMNVIIFLPHLLFSTTQVIYFFDL